MPVSGTGEKIDDGVTQANFKFNFAQAANPEEPAGTVGACLFIIVTVCVSILYFISPFHAEKHAR